MITIIGLGRDKDDITLKGKREALKSKCLTVRTLSIPQCRRFSRLKPITMDDLFERAESFLQLNSLIAQRLIQLEKEQGEVAYLVSGDGFTDGVANELKAQGAEVNIVQGISDFGAKTPAFSHLSYTSNEFLSILPYIDTAMDLSICEISDSFLASEVKLALLKLYAPNKKVVLSHKNKQYKIELCEIDRQRAYNYSTTLFVEGEEGFNKERYCFNDLMRIMQRLTATDGCEWDKEQTHNSIRVNLVEEAYEAVDAIDSGDLNAMIEELGDVMLQSIFHCDIAKRSGEFELCDVIHSLAQKLVSRHTHIFGTEKALNSVEALGFWEKAKQKEKSLDTLKATLDSVPSNFASLLKAQKLVKKAKDRVCNTDKESLKQDIIVWLKKDDYGMALFLLAALCEREGISAEIELNRKCGEFKDGLLTKKEKESLTGFFKIRI